MAEILEMMMVICFGLSWPVSIRKSWTTRSTTGKSLLFMVFIEVGYLCGIAGKLLAPNCKWYVLFFYILNCFMVGIDLVLYVRNYRLDQQQKA